MRKLYIWISLAVGLVIFFILMRGVSWRELMQLVYRANPNYLAIYLITSLIIMLQLGLRWKIILRAKGIKLPFLTATAYRFVGFAMSFVTPGPRVGGETVTAGLLMRHEAARKKMRFSAAFSTIIIDRAIEVQTFAILFFIGVLLLASMGDIPAGIRIFMIVISIILLAMAVFFIISMIRGKSFFSMFKWLKNKKLKKELFHFEDTIFNFYRHDWKEFVLAHVVAGIAWLLSLVEFKYLLLLLGFDVPLYGVFIVFSFVGLAYVTPIPLALGSLEGGQAAAFSIIGLPTAGGFLLAMVTRLRDIVFTIIGFMILMYYGIAPRTLQKTVR